MADNEAESTDLAPIEIRVTTQGKMRNFIQYGVKCLQENPERPLVLHTLPPRKSHLALKQKKKAVETDKKEEEKESAPTKNDVEMQDHLEKEKGASPDTQKPGLAKSPSSLSYSTTVIPKLISCVEVIKREWIQIQKANIPTKISSTEGHKEEYAHGLEQYNEISTLEEVTDEDFDMECQPQLRKLNGVTDEERPEMIISLLSRKKFARIRRTPYMRVTLCSRILDLPGNATYQPPPPPIRLSKGARRRARARVRKNEAAQSITKSSEESKE